MGRVLGIDLGTSNSGMAIAEWVDGSECEIEVLPILQRLAGGLRGEATTLPSALYIPTEAEKREDSSQLPLPGSPFWFGEEALERSSTSPDRVVVSAKSWLALSAVDRKGAILPWGSSVSQKVSPLEASSSYLSYLLDVMSRKVEGGVSSVDNVVVTVPASFDEVARQLTVEAVKGAGIEATLLEEPLAAVYSWLGGMGESWRDNLVPEDVILVVDIGGGTTDLSLVRAFESDGELALERVAVGNHLLVGGDNMDLAVAFNLKKKLQNQGHALDVWQFKSMIFEARRAKEKLLADDDLDEVSFSIASKGSDIFAQAISVKVNQEEINQWLVEGFFPLRSITELPRRQAVTGIQKVGLQYEAEPEIPRHIAQFLTANSHGSASSDGVEMTMPTKVLFNGGVFKSDRLRHRTLDLLKSWGADCEELPSVDFDLAVAKGAAYYGEIKRSGVGHKIKAGTARSYYLGLEEAAMAIPGMEPEIKGLCVVPQGTEEGTELNMDERVFGLMTGAPVEFRFFSSLARTDDDLGTVVEDAMTELDESNCISVTLDDGAAGVMVPVHLKSVVNEIGTLDLIMQAKDSDKSWKLEFDIRGEEEAYG